MHDEHHQCVYSRHNPVAQKDNIIFRLKYSIPIRRQNPVYNKVDVYACILSCSQCHVVIVRVQSCTVSMTV